MGWMMLVVAAAGLAAQEPADFEIRFGSLASSLHGQIQADEGNDPDTMVEGDRLSLGSDLGLSGWSGGATVDARIQHFRFGYLATRWDGTETLDRTRTFNGYDFRAGERLRTQAEYDHWELAFAHPVGSRKGPLTGGVDLALRFSDLFFQMDGSGVDGSLDPVPGRETDERTQLGWLGLGGRTDFELGGGFHAGLRGHMFFAGGESEGDFNPLWLFNPFFWLFLETEDEKEEWSATMADLQASVGGQAGPLDFELGFRLVDLRIKSEREESDSVEDNHYDLRFGGPTFSIGLRF